MRKRGHIRISRRMFDGQDAIWDAPEPFDRRSAWVDLIQYAEWRPRQRLVSGRPVELSRGEFLASIRFLAARWRWGTKRVRLFLSMLSDTGRIRAQRETQGGTVYLVAKYAQYQATPAEQGTPKGTARAQRGHKVEEGEEDRRDKSLLNHRRNSYPADFEEAWSAYPDRQGGNPKKGAYRAWCATLKRGEDAAQLVEATKHYADYCRNKGKVGTEYVKQAATFFGPDEPWREYLQPVRPAQRGGASGNPAIMPWSPPTAEELEAQNAPTRSLVEFRKARERGAA